MSSDKVLDELLVVQFQAGNMSALKLLYKRWNKRLIQRAYWQTKDMSAAKDIAQDVWLVIMKDILKLKEAGRFAPWALMITYRKAIDHVRQIQKERKQSSGIEKMDSLESVNIQPEDDTLATMQTALQLLSTEQRNIITLFYLDGQSVKSIADILEIPLGTVKSRLFNAREKLKTIIKERNKKKHYENE